MLDGSAALAVSAVVFVILVLRTRSGLNPAVTSMPMMIPTGGIWGFTASEAFGITATLWAWASLLLGLLVPSQLWNRRRLGARRATLRLHRTTSLTVIWLTVAHAALLLADGMGDRALNLFIPFTPPVWPPDQFPTALGILSLYAAILAGPSYYLRGRIGARTWRWIHRGVVPLIYVLALWHSLLYAHNVTTTSFWLTLLWTMQIPVILALAYRLHSPTARDHSNARHSR